MAFQFVDSSALVKKYLLEAGTARVRSIFNAVPSQEIYVSRVTQVEVTSAIVRRRKAEV
ncbi:MAG: hypothetical protein WKF34_14115 [Pyrinomonadaceae bacterium]